MERMRRDALDPKNGASRRVRMLRADSPMDKRQERRGDLLGKTGFVSEQERSNSITALGDGVGSERAEIFSRSAPRIPSLLRERCDLNRVARIRQADYRCVCHYSRRR